VCLVHLDVVHVCLPVFDKAAVVGGQHPQVVVAPDHRPNGRVVRLHKSQAVTTASNYRRRNNYQQFPLNKGCFRHEPGSADSPSFSSSIVKDQLCYIIIIVWFVQWWTLPCIQECSKLVDYVLNDRQLPDQY